MIESKILIWNLQLDKQKNNAINKMLLLELGIGIYKYPLWH